MAEFVGFDQHDAEILRRSKPIIEKHLPQIMAEFYAHLMRYPPTRKFFLKKDGTVDTEYLELRMRHQTNFWLRVCNGNLDLEFARFLEYVGRAHTSRGADPQIYIAERYVVGQVGFMAHAIAETLREELQADPDFENQAQESWDKAMMIILEVLARAYGHEHKAGGLEPLLSIDERAVERLAEEAFRLEHDKDQAVPRKRVRVARVDEVPEGKRKIVQVEGLSIGLFNQQGQLVALNNFCLHRGGPVCTGSLQGNTLTCPWHGFQYALPTGQMLIDPNARLESYPVEVEDGEVYVLIPMIPTGATPQPTPKAESRLQANQFAVEGFKSGTSKLVQVDGEGVVVYNLEGSFYATQQACPHMEGPLEEGGLGGFTVTCPWHGSQFDVRDGRLLRGPAQQALKTFRVRVEDGLGRVEQ
jgi:nitrite reductase/ring-hydroxylating ferredoxin subunit/hemoglobin-like flavoprotein